MSTERYRLEQCANLASQLKNNATDLSTVEQFSNPYRLSDDDYSVIVNCIVNVKKVNQLATEDDLTDCPRELIFDMGKRCGLICKTVSNILAKPDLTIDVVEEILKVDDFIVLCKSCGIIVGSDVKFRKLSDGGYRQYLYSLDLEIDLLHSRVLLANTHKDRHTGKAYEDKGIIARGDAILKIYKEEMNKIVEAFQGLEREYLNKFDDKWYRETVKNKIKDVMIKSNIYKF